MKSSHRNEEVPVINWTIVSTASINLTSSKDTTNLCKYHQILMLHIGYKILTSILNIALNKRIGSI